LFGGEKGIEKAAGDPHFLVDLFHRGVLDALAGHPLQSGEDQPLPDFFPVFLRISNLRHYGPSPINTSLINCIYFITLPRQTQQKNVTRTPYAGSGSHSFYLRFSIPEIQAWAR